MAGGEAGPASGHLSFLCRQMGEMGEGEMAVEVGGRFVAAGVSSSSLRCRLSSSWTWGRMEEEEGGSGSD